MDPGVRNMLEDTNILASEAAILGPGFPFHMSSNFLLRILVFDTTGVLFPIAQFLFSTRTFFLFPFVFLLFRLSV
jgi:hypothetical protein